MINSIGLQIILHELAYSVAHDSGRQRDAYDHQRSLYPLPGHMVVR